MPRRQIAKPRVMKTFRFSPDHVKELNKAVRWSMAGGKRKYTSLTQFVIVATSELIARERRELEQEGVAWEHLDFNI